MLSLLHWKNKPVLTLLDSFIAFFPTKPCFFQEIYISTFVSTSKLWQFGIRCHDSIKATNVLVLPNPRDTENSKRVPLPTGSLELSPCPLWHHPLKLSSPFLALLPGHWSYLLSFHYRPFFCSPCKCLHSPKFSSSGPLEPAGVNFGANRKLCCLSLKFNLSLSRSVLEICAPFRHTQVLSSILQNALALEARKVPIAYFCIT